MSSSQESPNTPTTSSGSLAFQDEFTHSHGGNCYFVAVDPIFKDQISELVNLIARSRPENVRVSYTTQFIQAAKQASGGNTTGQNEAAEEQHNDDGQDDDDDDDDDEQHSVAAPAVEETPEIREAKRKVIRDFVSSIKSTTNQPLRIQATDKELEGFVNLVLSLILQLFPADHPDLTQLITILTDAVSFSMRKLINPTLSARYAAIATIFNSLPSTLNTLRLNVLLKLIAFAASNDDFTIIEPALVRLESYLIEWGFGPGTQGEEEGNAAVANVFEALSSKGKLNEARAVLLAHLSAPSAVAGQSTTPSASAAKLASQLIALSLALPQMYDFASLVSIPAVASPSTPALASLLSIFQSGDVASFQEFAKQNQDVLSEYHLDAEALTTKLRLLALAELCSHKVGQDVSYTEIASSLRLQQDNGANDDDDEQVETWVIDAIRASLISGRLSQSLASFHVTRAAPRTFTAEHWSHLATRLHGWRRSLDGILDSVRKGLPTTTTAAAGSKQQPQSSGGPGAVELAQQLQQQDGNDDDDDDDEALERGEGAAKGQVKQEVTVA